MARTLLRVGAASLAALALALTSTTSAYAGTATIREKGDVGDALDIWSGKVVHGKKKVVTTAKLRNLQKNKNQGVAFHLKTGPKKKRYAVLVSLRKKERAVLLKAKSGQLSPVKCKKLRFKQSYKRDSVKVVVPRKCLGKPGKVRLRVETGKINGKRVDITRYSSWAKRG